MSSSLAQSPPPALVEPEPVAFGPEVGCGVGQAYLLFAVCMCLLVSVGWTANFFGLPGFPAFDEILLILLPAVVYVRWKRLPVAASLGWRKISPGVALFSVVLGISEAGISAEIHRLQTIFIGTAPFHPPEDFSTPRAFLIALMCYSIFPGVCEETLFRGAILGTLRRLGPGKAVLISALLFGMFHLSRSNFLSPLFGGIVLGILTLRTGSTVPAMIVHGVGNATAMTANYLFASKPSLLAHFSVAALSALFVGVFGTYLVRNYGQTSVPGPLTFAPTRLPRWGLAATVVGGVLFVWAAFFVFQNWVAWHVLADYDEVPGLHVGDRALVVRGPFAHGGLEAGAIAEIMTDGRSRLVQLARCDYKRVWIVGWPETVRLQWKEITGRVVRTDKQPAD